MDVLKPGIPPYSDIGGGGKLPPHGEDFFNRIVNVHWPERRPRPLVTTELSFLVSFADAMYGSKDGKVWQSSKSAVTATSLAWLETGEDYGTWVGCNPKQGTWRSLDGGASWQSCGPPFEQVVASQPEEIVDDPLTGRKVRKAGFFAAWSFPSEGSIEQIVYVSSDLGATWSSVLIIKRQFPSTTVVDNNGYEDINGLGGGKGKLFVCTTRGESDNDQGSGYLYESDVGGAFVRRMVMGPGTVWVPPAPSPSTFSAYSLVTAAYDVNSKNFALFGLASVQGSGIVNEDGTYGLGLDSATSSYIHATRTSGIGQDLFNPSSSAAGGYEQFVTGINVANYTSDGLPTSVKAMAYFTSGGSTTLEQSGSTEGIWQGSYCYNPLVLVMELIPGQPGQQPVAGIFGCASANGSTGRVWTASPGSIFTVVKSGMSIDAKVGLGVGVLSFLQATPS
jgi:hypothetical protein